MQSLTVSSRVLSQRSNLPMRQVQTLTDARVLLPDEGSETPGRGASRQYAVVELEVAMLLAPIMHKGMSVQEARGLAEKFRAMASAPQTFGFRELGEALEMRKRLVLGSSLTRGDKPDAGSVQFAPGTSREADPPPAAIETITAWIILESAKWGRIDPVMFLYRCDDGSWGHEFWGLLAVGEEAPTEYRVGPVSVRIDAEQALDFDALILGLGSHPGQRIRPRGGFVLMPREIFAGDWKSASSAR